MSSVRSNVLVRPSGVSQLGLGVSLGLKFARKGGEPERRGRLQRILTKNETKIFQTDRWRVFKADTILKPGLLTERGEKNSQLVTVWAGLGPGCSGLMYSK